MHSIPPSKEFEDVRRRVEAIAASSELENTMQSIYMVVRGMQTTLDEMDDHLEDVKRTRKSVDGAIERWKSSRAKPANPVQPDIKLTSNGEHKK